MALSDAAEIVSWIRQVLTALIVKQSSTIILQDNYGSMDWAEGVSARYFSCRKHIDLHHHFVMQMIAEQDIHIERIGTEQMLADILTNPFAKSDFQFPSERLNIFRIDLVKKK